MVPKSSQPKVPQKARPRVRVRLAQEVQEVEPESYDQAPIAPRVSAPLQAPAHGRGRAGISPQVPVARS